MTSVTEYDHIDTASNPSSQAAFNRDPKSPTVISEVHAINPLVVEARVLNDDVDAWIESLQLSTLEHERVQVGNRAYAYAIKVNLLVNALVGC